MEYGRVLKTVCICLNSLQHRSLTVYNSDNFDHYWRVASKVTPTAGSARSQSPAPPASSVSLHTRPPSADPAGPSDRDGAYNVRSVPVRIYLPDGPVLQDLVPPLLEDGKHSISVSLLTSSFMFLYLNSTNVLHRFFQHSCKFSHYPYTSPFSSTIPASNADA